MIHFYASGRHTYPFTKLIKRWSPQLGPLSTISTYSTLDLAAPLPAGLHVLTDFERLVGPERAMVRRLHRLLSSRPQTHRVIGNPTTWLPRHELLTALHERGINDFRSHRLREVERGADVRYPAFLRWANEHGASLGEPVGSRAELDERVRTHVGRRRHVLGRNLLVVEIADVRSPDGLFRKYSAMRIGDTIIPRHVFFTQHWITKNQDLTGPAFAAEEMAFAESFGLHDGFPHAERIREVYEIAGMDYGRIDYSVLDGRLRVWEINSNPIIGSTGLHPSRHRSQRLSADRTTAAFLDLVPDDDGAGSPPLLWPRAERAAWRTVAAAGRRYDPRRR